MLKQCVTFAWILANCAILHFYQIIIWLCVRPLSRPLSRNLISLCVQEPWMDVMACIFPSTTMHISGDFPSKDYREKIILCNHQADADWLYVWQMSSVKRAAGQIKIVLKDSLKHVPIIGWGMRMLDFLFLKRDWDKDKPHVYKHLQAMIRDKFPFWLLVFPEGTTIHKEAVEKSHTYASKLNRPKFSNVLLPRTTGLIAILEALEDTNPDIYDMTIAYGGYSGEIPSYSMGFSRNIDIEVPSMAKLLNGIAPRDVHIYIKKYSSHDIDKDLVKWLDKRWQEKENMLEYFKKHQTLLPPNSSISSVTIHHKEPVLTLVKLWTSFFVLVFLSPVLMLIAFPCYFICASWIITTSIMRGALDWLPYFQRPSLLKCNECLDSTQYDESK